MSTLLIHGKLGPNSVTHKIFNYKDIGLKLEKQHNSEVICSYFNFQFDQLRIDAVMIKKLNTQKKRVFLDGHFIEGTVVLAGSGRLESTLLIHDKLGLTSLSN